MQAVRYCVGRLSSHSDEAGLHEHGGTQVVPCRACCHPGYVYGLSPVMEA